MKRLNTPTLLLWLPVVVWAATFTLLTMTFFLGNQLEDIIGNALYTTFLVVLIVNIIAVSVTSVAMTVYQSAYKEYLLRLLLMLSNVPAVIIYKLIYQYIFLEQ